MLDGLGDQARAMHGHVTAQREDLQHMEHRMTEMRRASHAGQRARVRSPSAAVSCSTTAHVPRLHGVPRARSRVTLEFVIASTTSSSPPWPRYVFAVW